MAICVPTVHVAHILRAAAESRFGDAKGAKPITDVIRMDYAKAWQLSQEGVTHREHLICLLPNGPVDFMSYFGLAKQWMQYWLQAKPPLAVDVESTSLEYAKCNLHSIAIAEGPPNDTAISFPLIDLRLLPEMLERELLDLLRRLLADLEIVKVFHNAAYDTAVLDRKGLPVRGPIEDTMGLHHIVQPDIPHDLGFIGHTYLQVGAWKMEYRTNEGYGAKIHDPWKLLTYNAKDALYTAQLVPHLKQHIYDRGMSDTLIQWQNAYAELSREMEHWGLPVNMELRAQVSRTKLRRILQLQRDMRTYLQWPDFNPMSPSHKTEALYSGKYSRAPWDLGLTPTATTEKKGDPSTSYKAIIDHIEHPFVAMLVEYVEERQAYGIQFRDEPDEELAKIRSLGVTPTDFAGGPPEYDETEDAAAASADGESENDPIGPEDISQEIRRAMKGKQCGAYRAAIVAAPGAKYGRLFAKWKPYDQKGIRQTSSPNCYDAETELLTEAGWVPFPEAKERGLRAIQYDRASSVYSLATSTSYVEVELFSGDPIVEISTQDMGCRVTEDHRMLIETRKYYGADRGRWQERVALAGELATSTPSKVAIPVFSSRSMWYPSDGIGSEPSEAQITILCACQADGWRRKYGKGEAWAFYFAKKRKVRRLQAALKALGNDADWCSIPLPRKEGREQTAIYLKASPVKNWVDTLLGPNKEFGCWLLSWSTLALLRFSFEVTQWDGRHDRGNEYSSTVQKNVDWAQAASILSGYGAGATRVFWGNRSKKPCYQVLGGPKSGRAGFRKENIQRKFLTSPEKFYCATVPSGFLLVRRHGKPMICGNCQNMRDEDRKIFEAPDGWAFWGGDKSNLELRLIAARSGCQALLDVLIGRTPPSSYLSDVIDPHTFAAVNVFGKDWWQSHEARERKQVRSVCKNVEYCGFYLGGPERIWTTSRQNKRIDMDLRRRMKLELVRQIHAGLFHGLFAEIYRWHEKNIELVKKQGYLEMPPFGRRRYSPVMPPPAVEFANASIQVPGAEYVTSEACQIMWDLQKKFKGEAYLVAHLHDQLAGLCLKKHLAEVEKIFLKHFGDTKIPSVAGDISLSADFSHGPTLYHTK